MQGVEEASGEAGSLALRSLCYFFSGHRSSLIRNARNLFFRSADSNFRADVCGGTRVSPATIQQISGATLRRASPAAARGNCFLIKPPALIPMIFSRHKVPHARSAKSRRWLRERAAQQGNLLGCEQDKNPKYGASVTVVHDCLTRQEGK